MTNDALLAEYSSLREEIIQRHRNLVWILSFTLALTGVILTIFFSYSPYNIEKSSLNVLIYFLLILIIGALILTTENTQQIFILSQYIINFIEPKVGIGAEREREKYWIEYCIYRKFPIPGLLADQRGLVIYYFILVISIYSLFISLKPAYIPVIISSILAIFALLICLDLYLRMSKSWDRKWNRS